MYKIEELERRETLIFAVLVTTGMFHRRDDSLFGVV